MATSTLNMTQESRKSTQPSVKVVIDVESANEVHYSLHHEREHRSGTSTSCIHLLDGFVSFDIPVQKVIATRLGPALNLPQSQCITLIIKFAKDSYIYDLKKKLSSICSPVAVNSADKIATKAAPLLKHLKNLQKEKENVSTKGSTRFLKNKGIDEVILKYPFVTDMNSIETACKCSIELKNGSAIVDSRKTGQVALTTKDYMRLSPKVWLNDNVLNLWMLLITRAQPSDVHVVSSHFFTKLCLQGPKEVESWSKKIDVFQKRIVIIPINKNFHWSLCVLINPAALTMRSEYKNISPFLLFFDSCRLHSRRRIESHIFGWLNFEYCRLKEGGTQAVLKTLHRLTPKVPLQKNGYDCGVFVLKYAQAICKLKSSHIDYSIANTSKDGISDMIANSQHFKFTQKDIDRIRIEFKAVIQNLHPIYMGEKYDSNEAKNVRQREKLLRGKSMGRIDSIRVDSETKESTPFAAEAFDKISPTIHKASVR